MITTMTDTSKQVLSIILAAFLLVGIMFFSTGKSEAAGVETLPLGSGYDIGSFSFQDCTGTHKKTIEGRYAKFLIQFKRSSTLDNGIATTPIKLTVELRDYYTDQRIGSPHYAVVEYGHSTLTLTPKWDTGTTGREVYLFFDASSYNGPTNGGYRGVDIDVFQSEVTNS